MLYGDIHLIRGNHDKGLSPALERRFVWVKDTFTLKVEDPDADGGTQRIVLFHYAMRVWDRSHHGAWHLYGHSHGSLPDTPTSLSMDVGVDTHDFRPWHFDEIGSLITARAKVRDEQG